MLKKMMLLAMTVGALAAFAAPVVAQAEIRLRDGDTVFFPDGTEITVKSTNFRMTLGAPNPFPRMECGQATWHMTIAVNGPDHVILIPHQEMTTEGCVLNLNGTTKLPATITDGTVGEATIDTWGRGHLEHTLKFDIPAAGLANCALAGNPEVHATGGTDILHVEPSILTQEAGSPGGCSNAATIEGSFTLEANEGEELVEVEAVNTD